MAKQGSIEHTVNQALPAVRSDSAGIRWPDFARLEDAKALQLELRLVDMANLPPDDSRRGTELVLAWPG